MTRKLLCVIMTLLVTMTAMAQETDAMLFGDVKSKVTGKHIPYAKIQVKGTKLTAMCDKTGHFQMSNLPLGKQTVVASCMGYESEEREVMMQHGKGSEVYFQLDEDEQELNQVVVTGTRTQHYLKDVPIRTEVLT